MFGNVLSRAIFFRTTGCKDQQLGRRTTGSATETLILVAGTYVVLTVTVDGYWYQ